MTKSLPLTPIISLDSLIREGELVAFNVGHDGVVYLVVALQTLDYRRGQEAMFAKTVPTHPQTYRVIGLLGAVPVLDLLIEGECFNIHDIQPLGQELLLVCARSYYRGPNDFERNGRVYNRNGRFAREILLGDGIQSVQVTARGTIWTSYFDEGIFGNYGWEYPVGALGLVAWDSYGNKLYEFQPTEGLDSICDCYAMNAETEDDVWIYYYTEFPLVHLRSRRIESAWDMPLAGSDAFAISNGNALFRGGYEDHDTYRLFDITEANKAALVGEVEFLGPRDTKLIADRVVGRGDSIFLMSSGSIYRADLNSVIGS